MPRVSHAFKKISLTLGRCSLLSVMGLSLSFVSSPSRLQDSQAPSPRQVYVALSFAPKCLALSTPPPTEQWDEGEGHTCCNTQVLGQGVGPTVGAGVLAGFDRQRFNLDHCCPLTSVR
jgi:hypothetical protein